jgi:transposase
LSVEDWAEIRRLHRAEGLPIKLIARTLGVSRNTVRAAIVSEGPPKYDRRPAGSAVDAFEAAIREQLLVVPTMPATVIAERVGWTRGMTVFKDRVRELRPAYLPPDPCSRTSYVAGEIAQCDLWFPPIELPVGFGQERRATQLPVLTMVTGYSRSLSAVPIPTRRAGSPFGTTSSAEKRSVEPDGDRPAEPTFLEVGGCGCVRALRGSTQVQPVADRCHEFGSREPRSRRTRS